MAVIHVVSEGERCAGRPRLLSCLPHCLLSRRSLRLPPTGRRTLSSPVRPSTALHTDLAYPSPSWPLTITLAIRLVFRSARFFESPPLGQKLFKPKSCRPNRLPHRRSPIGTPSVEGTRLR